MLGRINPDLFLGKADTGAQAVVAIVAIGLEIIFSGWNIAGHEVTLKQKIRGQKKKFPIPLAGNREISGSWLSSHGMTANKVLPN
jgi:hypothetical protein